MTLRCAADLLTAIRMVCGAILAIRPSVAVLIVGAVSDWIDGPLARRAGPTERGARADLDADSILTLGAAIAAVRCGAPRVVLIAPLAHYVVPSARSHDEVRWDRITGVAQMLLLGAALMRLPIRWLATPVSAVRCAVLLARVWRSR